MKLKVPAHVVNIERCCSADTEESAVSQSPVSSRAVLYPERGRAPCVVPVAGRSPPPEISCTRSTSWSTVPETACLQNPNLDARDASPAAAFK